MINDIKQDISIQLKPDFTVKPVSKLMDYEFMWRMDDMQDTESMAITLEKIVDKAEKNLKDLYDSVTTLMDSTNNCKSLKYLLEMYQLLTSFNSEIRGCSIMLRN